MSENKLNNSIVSLSDRLSDMRFFISIMVIIMAANVGLQVAGDENLWNVFLQDKIHMKQYAYIGMGILVFIPFNIHVLPILVSLCELIYVLIKYKFKSKNISHRRSEQTYKREETYFSVDELLSYAIKYNNSILKSLYEKELLEIENNKKLKNIIGCFWLFLIIDICYKSSIIRQLIVDDNKIAIMCLLLFQIGCMIYVAQPEKKGSSITNISKRFNDSLSLDKGEEYFPK